MHPPPLFEPLRQGEDPCCTGSGQVVWEANAGPAATVCTMGAAQAAATPVAAARFKNCRRSICFGSVIPSPLVTDQ